MSIKFTFSSVYMNLKTIEIKKIFYQIYSKTLNKCECKALPKKCANHMHRGRYYKMLSIYALKAPRVYICVCVVSRS